MTSSTDLFCEFNTFTFQAVESIRYNKISIFFPFKRKTTPNYITMNKLRLKNPLLPKIANFQKTQKISCSIYSLNQFSVAKTTEEG